MRFERLLLTAFGPFQGEVLELSGGAPGGLHVVFGPNEAGKSTSLRAVSGFLYGIPQRSPDAHLHALPRLEVAAQLAHEGETFFFRRLKRRKDTLVDGEGNPVDEGLLQRLLGYVDKRTFESRLGLDQAELEKGAEALLGGSEQGLFAAGTAGADVRGLLDDLEQTCSELFLAKGKNPRLNRALLRYQEAQKLALDSVRLPEKWAEQKRALEAAVARADALRRARRDLKEEHGQLTRLGSLLSDLASLVEVESRLRELSDVPALDEAAPAERVRAERELRDADIELRQGEEGLAELVSALSRLGERTAWADLDESALDLRNRIGSELKARRDLPKRAQELENLRDKVVLLAASLGFQVPRHEAIERMSALLPGGALVRRTHQLIAREGKLRAELVNLRQKCAEIAAELDRETELEAPDPLEIERLVVALADGRDLRAELSHHRDLAEKEEGLAARSHRLAESLGLRPTMAYPTGIEVAAAEQADAQFHRFSSELGELTARAARLRLDEQEHELRLQQLVRGVELPTPDQLQQARQSRDRALRAVLAGDWLGGRADHEVPLLVAEADRVADQRCRESNRIAQREEIEKERERLALKREAAVRALEQLDSARRSLVRDWSERFLARGPLRAPDEGQWAKGARVLLELEETKAAREGVRRRHELLGTRFEEARVALNRLLEAPYEGERQAALDPTLGLSGLVELGEARLVEMRRREELSRQKRNRRSELSKNQRSLQQSLREAEGQVEAWEQEWQEVSSALGQARGTSTEAIAEILLGFADLSRVIADALSLGGRIQGIERDSKLFSDDIERVAKRHGPDLLGRDHLDAAEEIGARMEQARAIESERARLNEEIRRRRAKIAEAQKKRALAESLLQTLVVAAGAEDASQLPELESQARERREMLVVRARLRQALADKSGGQSVESLLAEAASVEHRKLFARVDELSDRIDELELELRDAEGEVASLSSGLELYHSERAADARQDVLSRGAEARELLRRYLVHKTAQTLLEREITSYAERYAGPLARRAGELFERLTLGKYQGLRVSPFEKTIRMRRMGQEVEVDQLSRGTRAQLYFALRVASLESYFGERPPVPLLLDDLFVDFDDDRTSVAFEILGELARGVQILYFTHLARDVHLASDAVPAALLFEHRLGQS